MFLENLVAFLKALKDEQITDEQREQALEGAVAAMEQEIADAKAQETADVTAEGERDTAIEARITALEANPGGVDLGPLTARVTTLEEEAVADLAATDGRLDALEAKPAVDLTPVNARLDALETGLAAVDANFTPPPPPPPPPPVPLTIAPTDLGAMQVGVPFTNQIVTTGAAGPFSPSILAGAFPDGITMGAGGGITGTPTTAGPYDVTIQSHDANGDSGSQQYTGTVADVAPPPAPAVIDQTSVDAVVGAPLTTQLTASNPPEAGSVVWSGDTSALPDVTLGADGTLTVGAAAAESGVIHVTATFPDGTAVSGDVTVNVA